MIEEDDSGMPVVTSGCLGLEGSDFQCRVRDITSFYFVTFLWLDFKQSGFKQGKTLLFLIVFSNLRYNLKILTLKQFSFHLEIKCF